MKKYFSYSCILSLGLLAASPAAAQPRAGLQMAEHTVRVQDVRVARRNGDLTLRMTLNLDSLQMPVNQQFVFTPTLTTASGSVDLRPIVINGRRQQIMYDRGIGKHADDDALVVCRKDTRSQRVDYGASVPVDDELGGYDLTIREDLCGCGDTLGAQKYTLRKYRRPVAVCLTPEAVAQKIFEIEKRAYIDFPVDRTELYPQYRRNPAQLDSIVRTINLLKEDPDLTVMAISIHGFASPESPYAHNDYLARNRARTLTDYVRRMVNLPAEIFSVASTAEDWDGLRRFVRESNLEHRDEILAICNDEQLQPDAREWKIKRTYPAEYRFMLDTWYPALRHSDYRIKYKVRPFSVDEAKEVIKTQPQHLSQNEMYLVAQTYPACSPAFNEIMEIAVRLFPNDATANLNAACSRLNGEHPAEAKRYLDKAGTSPEADNARGVYEVLTGNLEAARPYFEAAARAGLMEAQTNLDNLE